MTTTELIDSYTNDVARRLPRKIRNEVGLELRALLADGLDDAARQAGRAPDPQMALELLQSFGRPEIVAARYAPARGFNVIEPEHAPAFVALAVACVLLQWAFTLPRVFAGSVTAGDWWLTSGFGAFAWTGVLTLWFAVAGWIQRRAPVDEHNFVRPWSHYLFFVPLANWQPNQTNTDQRAFASARTLVPLGAVVLIFLISPAGILGALLPDRVDVSWARYDATFGRIMLPILLTVLGMRLAAFTMAAISTRVRTNNANLMFGLRLLSVGLLIWVALRWDIFAAPLTDLLFKAWLWVFLLVNVLQMIGWIRRAVTQVRLPASMKGNW